MNNNNALLLDKKWIAVYVNENKEKPLHIYHVKCATSRGITLGTKWMKCPKCKHKLPIWHLGKARLFVKTCQIANVNINI